MIGPEILRWASMYSESSTLHNISSKFTLTNSFFVDRPIGRRQTFPTHRCGLEKSKILELIQPNPDTNQATKSLSGGIT